MVIFVLSSGFIADFLRGKKISTTNVRKLMTCTGYIILGICLLLIGFSSNAVYDLILITIGIGFSGLIASGWRINHQDIACSYSGILAGISGTIGDSAGILSPMVAGYITKNQVIFINNY
jgi:ACS family sodium-dependent inorganic phosphate cotransporter-like MFS transporter 5